jgi:hypothetical protein
MATLKELLTSKDQGLYDDEENLERGEVYSFTPGTDYNNFCQGLCWCAPANGTAVIEIWGAGGSGAEMCCCGFGLPGNPGAYAKKTIQMNEGCYICGFVGMACGNATDLCFRGCSQATCLCWRGNGGQAGCMCAQGGRGGTSICSTTPSGYCCFRASGFCVTKTNNTHCGIVCNYREDDWHACAYGGDINYGGCFSCVSYFGCHPSCPCYFHWHLAVPPGQFAKCGGVVNFNTENNNGFSQWSGHGMHQHIYALNALSRTPDRGLPWAYCWSSGKGCGCYENEGCSRHVPVGHPGMGPFPCPGVRDHARAGGDGSIRIRFVREG